MTITTRRRGPGFGGRDRRRGSVLIAALWVVVVLAGIALVLGFEMQTEAQAQANVQAAAAAAAAELGAEQMLLSVVDQKMQDQANGVQDSTATIALDARPIGECYAWVITPTYDDGTTSNPEQAYTYGLTDEMGKLDLNIGRHSDLTPTSVIAMFEQLPGMTTEMAGSILTWSGATDPSGQGATDTYYAALPDPYQAKKAPFETVDELALVKDFTSDVLYGYDLDRNGVINEKEQQAGGLDEAFAAASGSQRGLMPFVTVLPSDALEGAASSASSGSSSDAATQIANINNETQLRQVLGNALGSARAGEVIDNAFGGGGGRNRRQAFTSVWAFYYVSGMTPEEFTTAYPRLTVAQAGAQGASTSPTAKVNIMTAPRDVLACLPGLQGNDSLVSSIITQRAAQLQTATDPTNLAWLVNIAELKNPLQLNDLGVLITGKSTVFSADIVAVAPNARAYKRVRVLIDGSQTPARIVYRRDLTQYGWPLSPDIRQQMKDGEPPASSTGFGMRGAL